MTQQGAHEIAKFELEQTRTKFQDELHTTDDPKRKPLTSHFYHRHIRTTWHSKAPESMPCKVNNDRYTYTVNTKFHRLNATDLLIPIPGLKIKKEYIGKYRMCWPHNLANH